ncbi:hypothetical protein RyT2_28510 [Pseudolactococcus yaeyamensis]
MPIKQGFSLLKLSLVLIGLIGVSLAYLPKLEKQVIVAEQSKKASQSDHEQKIILSKAINQVSKGIEYEAPQTVLSSSEIEEMKSSLNGGNALMQRNRTRKNEVNDNE